MLVARPHDSLESVARRASPELPIDEDRRIMLAADTFAEFVAKLVCSDAFTTPGHKVRLEANVPACIVELEIVQ
jgi:hypothetical protein